MNANPGRKSAAPSPPPVVTAQSAASLWTKRDVAAYLKINVRTVERLAIPRVSIVGTGTRPIVRYDPTQVSDWLDGRRSKPSRTNSRPPATPRVPTAEAQQPSAQRLVSLSRRVAMVGEMLAPETNVTPRGRPMSARQITKEFGTDRVTGEQLFSEKWVRANVTGKVRPSHSKVFWYEHDVVAFFDAKHGASEGRRRRH